MATFGHHPIAIYKYFSKNRYTKHCLVYKSFVSDVKFKIPNPFYEQPDLARVDALNYIKTCLRLNGIELDKWGT